MLKKLSLLAISTLALAACNDQASSGGSGGARQEIRVVGSSTVFPFAKAVAEAFTKAATGNKNPVVESTGTGGGIEAFCAGIGSETPDIANASRQMKKSEFETCVKNGVTEIVEIQVGIDGLAIAESNKGPAMKLTPLDVYKALAANPFGKPNTTKLIGRKRIFTEPSNLRLWPAKNIRHAGLICRVDLGSGLQNRRGY